MNATRAIWWQNGDCHRIAPGDSGTVIRGLLPNCPANPQHPHYAHSNSGAVPELPQQSGGCPRFARETRVVLLLWLTAGLLLCLTAPLSAAAPASWTILVYLDADNNLERAGIADLNQMEEAPANPPVNVVVQIDRIHLTGTSDDTSNGDWDTARRYLVQHGTDPVLIESQLLADFGELNMGAPQTLVDFVTWGMSHYPANHYALVLWNHGGGWRTLSESLPARSIAWDDTDGDYLTTAETFGALSSIRTSLGRNLDVVTYDACIMGALELAYPLRAYADYSVAAEENVPFWGFPYGDFLAHLAASPTMSAADLCRALVNTDRASYSHGSQGFVPVTMSAIDLSHITDVAGALSAFATELQLAVDAFPSYGDHLHTWTELAQLRDDRQQVDLGYFVALVREDAPTVGLQTAAEDLLAAYQPCIVANGLVGFDPETRTGLSLYYPFGWTINTDYYTLDLAADTTWDEFLSTGPTSTAYVADAFEPDGTPAQATSLVFGHPQGRHWFHVAGDVDTSTFLAQTGMQYVVQTERPGPDCDTELRLLAPDGTVLASDDPLGLPTSQLVWTCPATGAYAASVRSSTFLPDAAGSATAYDVYVAPVAFPDVAPSFWAFRHIEACALADYVRGFKDGTYHPEYPVTRAQMAAYIARALAGGENNVLPPPPGTQTFPDVPPTFWAYKYIEYCRSEGIAGGLKDGGYHPELAVTRAQMAVFVARSTVPAPERATLSSYTPPAAPDFLDVSTPFWAYRFVEYCFDHGIVQGYADGYHPERLVTRDQLAVYLTNAFNLL